MFPFCSVYAIHVLMLIALSIRDFVLVRALDLDLDTGFTALTGETGAGKSILLAALGFALGAKTGRGAIRAGCQSATVIATFDPPANHPVRQILKDNDIEVDGDEAIVIRRILRSAGSAKGYLNDAPVSARLLQSLSELLVEVHGQHAGQSLLAVAQHRKLLDSFAETERELKACSDTWDGWRSAIEARKAVETRLLRAQADREYLEFAVSELDKLDPQEGEAAALAKERLELQSSEKVAQAVEDALKQLDKSSPTQALSSASRALGRASSMPAVLESSDDAPLKVQLSEAADALERALIEASEAYESVAQLRTASDYSAADLEASETRLFALRAAARKYDVDVDQLAAVCERMRMQLDEIVHSDQALLKAKTAEIEGEKAFVSASEALRKKRTKAGAVLSGALKKELAPLKLEKAEFRVVLDPVLPQDAGPNGCDRIAFEVRTNPGAEFGPLHKIASGGEVARFALALKVCLAREGQAGTLIFDEADVGVGGAVAAAIGKRLHQLSDGRQVLAITHSPQVAAMADEQWRISKGEAKKGSFETAIDVLENKQRQEEIARMLAGAQITQEARAAATRLLARA